MMTKMAVVATTQQSTKSVVCGNGNSNVVGKGNDDGASGAEGNFGDDGQ